MFLLDAIRTLFTPTPRLLQRDPALAASQNYLAEALILATARLNPELNRSQAREVPDSWSIVLVRPYTDVQFLQWGLTIDEAKDNLPEAVETEAARYRAMNIPSTFSPVIMATREALELHDQIQVEIAEREAEAPAPLSYDEQLELERQRDLDQLQHYEDYPTDPERRRRFLLSRGLYEAPGEWPPAEIEEATENAA